MGSELYLQDYEDEGHIITKKPTLGFGNQNTRGFDSFPPRFGGVIYDEGQIRYWDDTATVDDLYITRNGKKYGFNPAGYAFLLEGKLPDTNGHEHVTYGNGAGTHVFFSGIYFGSNPSWGSIGKTREPSPSGPLSEIWGTVRARCVWDSDTNVMSVEVSINNPFGSDVADVTYTLSHNELGSARDFFSHVATDGIASGWFTNGRDSMARTLVNTGDGSPGVIYAGGRVPGFRTLTYKPPTGYWYASGAGVTIEETWNSVTDTISDVDDADFFDAAKWSGSTFTLYASGGTSPDEWAGSYTATPSVADFVPDANGKIDASFSMSLDSTSEGDPPSSITYRLQITGTGDSVPEKPLDFYPELPTLAFRAVDDGVENLPGEIVVSLSGLQGTGTGQTVPFNDLSEEGEKFSDAPIFLTDEPPYDVEEYADIDAFPGGGDADVLYVALDTDNKYLWDGSDYVMTEDAVPGYTGTWAHDITVTEGSLATKPSWLNADAEIGFSFRPVAVGQHRVLIRSYNTRDDEVGTVDEHWTDLVMYSRITYSSTGSDIKAELEIIAKKGSVIYDLFFGSSTFAYDDGIDGLVISNELTSTEYGTDNSPPDPDRMFPTVPYACLAYGGTATLSLPAV